MLLDNNFRQPILDYVVKYLTQLINTVFGAIDRPREALEFLYERIYFAYASEKYIVINNVNQLENYYRHIPENQFKLRMILKVTRPIIKLNFLVHGDSNVLSMMKFQQEIDLEDKEIVQEVVNYSDKLLSSFVHDLFRYKNDITSNDKDEITEKVSKSMEKLFSME